MNFDTLDCKEVNGGLNVKVRLQPRASRNAITGLFGSSLKVALTSPPVDGAANAACVEFFAELCGVAKGQVSIVSGHKSRDKVIAVTGATKAGFFAALGAKFKFD